MTTRPAPLKAPGMLALFRAFLNTWAARAFFAVLIASFGLWGISGTVRDLSGPGTSLAIVGDRRIEPAEFQDAFRKRLAEVSRTLGTTTEPTQQIKRAVAEQTLDRLIIQAALADESRRLGVAVPDEAVRQAVFEIPAFRGRTGQFDRTVFNNVMRTNNLTEPRFLDLMRQDLAQRQVIEAVQVGIKAPDTLTNQVFAFQRESRVAEYVEFAFAAAPEPPAPTDAELQRYYDNNPGTYSAPEFRRVKLVVLSPETIARDITMSDAEVGAYYEAHAADYKQPEKRSVQVVIAQDQAKAQAIAAGWIANADWDAVQKAASDAGAAAAALDDATPSEFPAPELAQAVFAAPADAVTGPVQSALGWQVFRVTKVVAGITRPEAEVAGEIRTKFGLELAASEIYAKAKQLEDAVSADPKLDQIPTDIGAAAAMGEMDARGMTRDGEPAPLPGPDALRPMLLTAAFSLNKGEFPRVTEGPGPSFFTMVVEDTEAPALKPFAEVAAQVREDVERDARRRVQEQAAAKLLAATKTGTSLDDAATVAGQRIQRTAPIARGTPAPGVAAPLIEPLFGLKSGEVSMVETPDAFLVFAPTDVTAPDPATDPTGTAQIRTALAQQLSQDMEITFATALRARMKPTVNRAMFDSLSQ